MSDWSAKPRAWSQCGQAASMASMVLSGRSANPRATPGRLGRGFFLRSGRFGFWPFEGGTLELPGVLSGPPSLASNAAIRATSAPIWACCASVNATRSSLERARRVARFTDTVNRNLRYRVKPKLRLAIASRHAVHQPGGEQLPEPFDRVEVRTIGGDEVE